MSTHILPAEPASGAAAPLWRFEPETASPADSRIERFLNDYFSDSAGEAFFLPKGALCLDREGLARSLSLPRAGDRFTSEYVDTYRIRQGVLHNPTNDRRTTEGVFHIVEGGLPVPDDKFAVPKTVFRNLWKLALDPPAHAKILPYTAGDAAPVHSMVSLLLKPVVCPEVAGLRRARRLEVRFFAPASLMGNLDFVEAIFGNGGDPHEAANDLGLDPGGWTGHTGCVILAPHLTQARKKDLGLPPEHRATARQKRDGMCWKSENELYNAGRAFKIVCRDKRGVIVTVIADNYFGYCKKEVKSQISYSANLFGFAEEEHAGGAVAYASFDLGEEFVHDNKYVSNGAGVQEVVGDNPGNIEMREGGYAVDRRYPDIVYVPENARFHLADESVSWNDGETKVQIPLLLGHLYILPSGYKVRLEPPGAGNTLWRLIGTLPEGTLCHKPCTVSGGGKSEISKSISDAILEGPFYVEEFKRSFDEVEAILARNFGSRFRDRNRAARPSRPILSPVRSLGSVIKLFTPSAEYTDEYNEWIRSIPPHVKDILFLIKRRYKPEWGTEWRRHFSVDVIDGHEGHELKLDGRKMRLQYLRVGHEENGSWRVFKLRQDFNPAEKVQVEDDITASIIVPSAQLTGLNPRFKNESVKIVYNCEHRLFQRPDDAVHPGLDRQAELDLVSAGCFLSNFQPLSHDETVKIVEDAIGFSRYSEPVRAFLESFARSGSGFVACSSRPRLVDGRPSKNPRYLQNRPDVVHHRLTYAADTGARLFHRLHEGQPLHVPVHAVLAGRRMNVADRKHGIPPLAVYNPIHYQELPELFLDFICSVTGKSPSTTGFGSEGALTKGPFNALPPVIDLNNALTGYILTGYGGFSSAAGTIGPRHRVDHDISLLVPEIWCRMRPEEQDARFLAANGYLEKIEDFKHHGKTVRASILGYRITQRFVRDFLGRIFSNPHAVFGPEILRPETQDMDAFAEAIENLTATQKTVARHYFEDGSVEQACPPLKALLHVMDCGHYGGQTLESAPLRRLFTREDLLASDWYRLRLEAAQTIQARLLRRHISYLETAVSENRLPDDLLAAVQRRLEEALRELEHTLSPDYISSIHGTIGADPSLI